MATTLRWLLACALLIATTGPCEAGFDDDFTGRTMRLDLHHTGDAGREVIYDAEHFFDGFAADEHYALATLEAALEARPRLALVEEGDGDIRVDASPAPAIERDMARLERYLGDGLRDEEQTLLLCDNDGQLQRLEEILGGQRRLPAGTRLALGSLAAGFELRASDPPLRVLNDHEIFRRARRVRH